MDRIPLNERRLWILSIVPAESFVDRRFIHDFLYPDRESGSLAKPDADSLKAMAQDWQVIEIERIGNRYRYKRTEKGTALLEVLEITLDAE